MDIKDSIQIEPEDCEFYQMNEGLLLIGRSDTFASMGFIQINPKATLQKSSSPVNGIFKQIKGKSLIKIYHGEEVREKPLNEGETLVIQANDSYTIENLGEDNMIYWKYDGDVYQMFEKLKPSLQHIPFEARKKSGYKKLWEEHKKR